MDVQEIGEILKAKREEKGLSLADIEQATKIRTRYLEAIEEGDLSAIPGMVYARGFIKSYAEFLGLDGQALLDQYRTDSPVEEPVEKEESEPAKTVANTPRGLKKSNLWTQLAMGIGVVGIMMIVYMALVHHSSSEPSPSQPQEATTQQNAAKQESASPSETAPKTDAEKTKPEEKQTPLEPVSKSSGNSFYKVKGKNITVQVTAPRGANWMQVVADGKIIASETLQKGSSRTFSAGSQLDLITGNSPAIDVTVNGQPVALEQVLGRYEFHFRLD
jgi:cytoskeleton protein RodZ